MVTAFIGCWHFYQCFSVSWRCSSGIFTAPSDAKVGSDTLQAETQAMDKLILFVTWSQEEQKVISCPSFCVNSALLCHYLHHFISHSCFKAGEWTFLGVWGRSGIENCYSFGFWWLLYTSKEIYVYGILHDRSRASKAPEQVLHVWQQEPAPAPLTCNWDSTVRPHCVSKECRIWTKGGNQINCLWLHRKAAVKPEHSRLSSYFDHFPTGPSFPQQISSTELTPCIQGYLSPERIIKHSQKGWIPDSITRKTKSSYECSHECWISHIALSQHTLDSFSLKGKLVVTQGFEMGNGRNTGSLFIFLAL